MFWEPVGSILSERMSERALLAGRVADRQPDKANRLHGSLRVIEQLPRQREDGISIGSDGLLTLEREAARDLMEIREFHLQRERLPLEMSPFEAANKLVGSLSESLFELLLMLEVMLERALATDRLADARGLNGTIVDAAGKVIKNRAHLTEPLGQVKQRTLMQILTREDAIAVQRLGGTRASEAPGPQGL